MGKRSAFAREARDFYPTPLAGVRPLIPHLPRTLDYWEPCAGNGALIDHLKALTAGRAVCHSPIDLEPGREDIGRGDALTHTPPHPAEMIITNPPWTRDVLHRMIVAFSDEMPTWLLFDADWVHTRQAIPYLPRLRRIVSVGRLRWVEGSPHTGKDNCAWHLFGEPSSRPAFFHGRT